MLTYEKSCCNDAQNNVKQENKLRKNEFTFDEQVEERESQA